MPVLVTRQDFLNFAFINFKGCRAILTETLRAAFGVYPTGHLGWLPGWEEVGTMVVSFRSVLCWFAGYLTRWSTRSVCCRSVARSIVRVVLCIRLFELALKFALLRVGVCVVRSATLLHTQSGVPQPCVGHNS